MSEKVGPTRETTEIEETEESEKNEITSKFKTTYLKDYQPPAYFIDEVELTFDLHDDYTRVTAKSRVRHNRHSQCHECFLNGDTLQLESIKLNGTPLLNDEYQVAEDGLTICKTPDAFELEIVTTIYPHLNTKLTGLYLSNNKYCTQNEAEGFRRITYYMDHPDVLARFTTTIIADEEKFPLLLSNGNLIASGKLEGGRHWAKWQDPFKKPSYLYALVAGDFDLLEDTFTTQSGREIKLRIYVEKGLKDQSYHAMHCLKEAMRWDEIAFGREYDLDIYMIVAINDFNAGAMENKGLNIFNTKYILAKPETATDLDYIHILSVIGHEYFHNWSGNRVTCRDWFQLSLKEGLTIFRDQSFTQDLLSAGVMRISDVRVLREVQFPEDAGPLAHPVRPESYIEINNFYTATVYNKGAEVLRMMQTILGKNQFRKGMDLYFAKYDGQAVTIEDFVKTMEDVSGIDLQQFRLWYSQAGTPVVTVQDDYDAQSKTYTLMISQTTPPTPNQPDKLPMHIPIKLALLDEEGYQIPLQLDKTTIEEEKVLHLKEASEVFQFHKVPSRPIASLLRTFSAPIKLNVPLSDHDLQFLLKHDTDAFNRWEAGQKYILRIMMALIQDQQNSKDLVLPKEIIETYQYVLDHSDDEYLLSEMLILPSEKYIGEQMNVVDVNAIHTVREFVTKSIACGLETTLLDRFKNYQKERGDGFNVKTISKRQLKNRMLFYLAYVPKHLELILQQFEDALHTNMTDTQAALIALSNIDCPERLVALEKFYETWQQDALVLDKWFSIQASTKLPTALQEVKKLLRHASFDIKNPNKVFSLIGTFSFHNHINFHIQNGEGYAFLRETVQQLDDINPQIAARMVKPLTDWRRYDKDRQKLMKQQLEVLLQKKKISNNVYELANKSLEA